jgi:hypothetical protein
MSFWLHGAGSSLRSQANDQEIICFLIRNFKIHHVLKNNPPSEPAESTLLYSLFSYYPCYFLIYVVHVVVKESALMNMKEWFLECRLSPCLHV